ncbi:MAG: site-2 protease family protein [Firmicutes bacterium]|nr:site-2 protease family protein [Bacillota bacterium]
MNTVVTIILAVLLFGLVIFLHELGHFLSAKAFGVKVNEFALGMGPKLFSFGKKETKYSLRLLPIGGFCAMEGEDEESEDERAFNRQKVWKRIIIVAAGAIMNILLGFLLMICLTVQEDAFKSTTVVATGDAVSVENGAFEPGDRITAINGYRIYNDYDLNFSLSRYADEPMEFTVVRSSGEKTTLTGVTLDYSKITGQDNGFAFTVQSVPKTFFTVVSQSAKSVLSITRLVWASLLDLISGKYGLEAVSGPVGTAQVIGEAASQGANFVESLNNILWIMALITVNLGVFNLLPVPALDGGRLLFLLVEAVRRKPIPQKYEGWVHAAGFVILIGFMLIVTFNDVWRLIRG